jgi:L-asparaginase
MLLSGGTIISVVAERTDALEYADDNNKLSFSSLVSDLPELAHGVEVVQVPFAGRLSSAITWGQWYSLLETVRSADATGEYSGIVVTHSSGTLEETAFLIDLLYTGETPVVFTSSVRPYSALGSDAHMNLIDAVRVASAARSDAPRVCVVSAGRIFLPSSVVKVDPYSANAYRASEAGTVGRISVTGEVVLHRPCRSDPKAPPSVRVALESVLAEESSIPEVPILQSFSTTSGAAMSSLSAAGVPGLVLVGQAGARIAPAENSVISDLHRDGFEVVVCGRYSTVPLEVSRAYRERAFHVSRTLSAVKARILLALAIGARMSTQEIANVFRSIDAA